jgi:hypothetical protein
VKDIGGHLGLVCTTHCHRSLLPVGGSAIYRRDPEGSLVKNTTILVQKAPNRCSPLGLWTATQLCAKKQVDVILYQFPDHLKRTFLHNRTAGSPRKDDGVGCFLPAVNVFNMGPPEDIHWRLCLTWAYICKNFDVILYQFPDHLERTFLHNRTAGSPEEDDGVGCFCQLVKIFNMGPPKACGGHFCRFTYFRTNETRLHELTCDVDTEHHHSLHPALHLVPPTPGPILSHRYRSGRRHRVSRDTAMYQSHRAW